METEQDRIYNHLERQGLNPCRIKIGVFVNQGGSKYDMVINATSKDLCEDSIVNKPIRVDNGDECTVPKHKFMDKIIALEDRIGKWKHVGPSCTEVQWIQMEKDLKHVTATRRACSADPDYVIPKSLLIAFNNMWKVYNVKQGKRLDELMSSLAETNKFKHYWRRNNNLDE